ncbi:MAG: homoserine O-succinyltransferase [Caulobacteraceae bacterium]
MGQGRMLEIGLVNNMPDAALQATERQFRSLIQDAAGDRPVRLRLFHMSEIARSDVAVRVLSKGGYAPLADLPQDGLDALIVTGAEPLAPRLQDETYWGTICELVDWAERHTRSTIWSCLAAHAAVLRLDGIERRPLPVKCSGVFEFAAQGRHPLVLGMGPSVLTPHSRTNALPGDRLADAGYDLLTASAEVGVDAFVREGESRFVFLQGHPEYDADALRLEYRRDLRRFLNGERAALPEPPRAAFDAQTEAALNALAAETRADPRPERFDAYAAVLSVPRGEASWRPAWRRFYANWIESLVEAHASTRTSRDVAWAAG